MNDDSIDPSDDGLGDQLRTGFDALARAAGGPPPLPDSPTAPIPHSTPLRTRRLVLAAAVLVALAIGATVVVATRDDGGEQLAAGEDPTTTVAEVRNNPMPPAEHRLMCPPALLDLSGLETTPTLMQSDALPGADFSTPYELAWQQGDRSVLLSYPARMDGALVVGRQDQIDLSDGRTGIIEKLDGVGLTVHEPPIDGTSICGTYEIALVGEEGTDGRQALIDAASAVRLDPPSGTAEVPNVVGMTEVEARDALARAGLLRQQREGFEGLNPEVIAQSPTPGTVVDIGTAIDLTMTPVTFPTLTVPPTVEVESMPIPTGPLVCPIARLQVDDEFHSQPTPVWGHTIEWLEDGPMGGYTTRATWPNREYASGEHGSRELTVLGRPALMHGGGDGQNLVYDTGLPGACRFLEVGVYGGPTVPEREDRAVELATDKITFAPPPTTEPPRVIGLTVIEAADRLARAGFIPDWGEDREIGDAPAEVPTDVVTGQTLSEPGVVRLTT